MTNDNYIIETEIRDVPKDWNRCKLGDFADVKSGFAFKKEEFDTEGVPIIKIKNIVPPVIHLGDTQFYSKEISKNLIPYLINYNDILISMTGSNVNQIASAVGKVGRYKFRSNALLNQRVGRIYITNQALCDEDYLYHFISRKEVNHFLASISSGSANQANISPKQIKDLEIVLPPLAEQKVIAGILTAISDKIEINLKMNETLEQIAQAIFKRWFIEFEFPDENGNPYKSGGGEIVDSELGELPKSWEVKTLGSSVRIKRGGSPRPIHKFIAETGYRWLKISDVTGLNSPFVFNIKEHIKFEGVKGTVLLKAGSLILSNSATPGIPKILAVDSCIHDGWLYFPESYFSNEYLYLLFMSIKPKLIKQGNGSVFTNLKTDILKEWMVSVPDETILSRFQEFIKPLFDQMFFCTNQQNILLQLRDSLLPKLITGKIRVPLNTEEENEARKT